MKKITLALLVLITLTLTSCGSNTGGSSQGTNSSPLQLSKPAQIADKIGD